MPRSYQTPLPRRLEDCTLSEVTARVVYQLVVLDYKRNPDHYAAHPFVRVGSLADHYRLWGFGYLHGPLISLAKFLMQGGTTKEWRAAYSSYRGVRAPFKSRLLRGPQR